MKQSWTDKFECEVVQNSKFKLRGRTVVPSRSASSVSVRDLLTCV